MSHRSTRFAAIALGVGLALSGGCRQNEPSPAGQPLGDVTFAPGQGGAPAGAAVDEQTTTHTVELHPDMHNTVEVRLVVTKVEATGAAYLKRATLTVADAAGTTITMQPRRFSPLNTGTPAVPKVATTVMLDWHEDLGLRGTRSGSTLLRLDADGTVSAQ